MALAPYGGSSDTLFRDMERMMDRSLSRAFGGMLPSTLDMTLAPRGSGSGRQGDLFRTLAGPSHPMDVVETAKAFEIHADAPGMSPSDIKIEVQDGMLSVSGSRAMSKEDKDPAGRAVRSERSAYSFARSFTLPENTKHEDITASMDKGVLTVTIPKSEAAPKPEPKRITVTSA